ncbi:MAG: glycosyltransferase family 39 protein [Chloroflexi bacterium]|nr:glycosyltransferase family 39 protein [Chloroflexota bacterium]
MRYVANQNLTLPITVICLLLFFALGSAHLKVLPIGNDEYNSLSHIQHPEKGAVYNLVETVQSVTERSQQHSPLYFLLLNMWRTLVGADLFVLRLLSLYFGLLTIAVAYHLAASFRDRQLGFTTLLITTFLAYHLFYSHTARMYTLLPLVASWLIWSYWKAVIEAKNAPRWLRVSLLASAVSILYLHYFGIMILAALGLYHLFFVGKNRRWWRITLLLSLAGLCFLPWLPVASHGFSNRISLIDTRLPLLDSLLTYFLVFSNGLFFLPLAAAALAARYHSRLNKAEKFILLITAFTLLLTVLANEFTPILVARRMRYMTLLAVPFSCSVAVGLRLMPRWNIMRVPLFLLWIAAFIVYSRSDDLLFYANKIDQNLHKTAHYQDFVYESENLPGHNELILSFHPDTPITIRKTLTYYRATLSKYAHLVHISYDDNNELLIQSGLTTYATLDAIAENAIGVWVTFDPRQTDLQTMEVYSNWFSQKYQACRRYVDKPDNIIDYYLRVDVPCELVNAAEPFSIRYDNGTILDHLLVRRSSDTLSIYLRWLQTIGEEYSFTLQVFDSQSNKVRQVDRVISGEPVDIVYLDISSLPAGEYSAKLIVYDFETGVSQPGLLIDGAERFERDIEFYRLSVPA